MSPEIIIAALARLNELLEKRFIEQRKKIKKFKQLQMVLFVLSLSVAFVLFFIYQASAIQMIFIIIGFNILFFVGFKPRSPYSEKSVKEMMQEIVKLQVTLKKFLMEEEVSFDGVACSSAEGWICDKWGLYREDERIDYSALLYDKRIKGLYLEALRNKK